MTQTPHGHWAQFDESLEMAKFDTLHAKFVATNGAILFSEIEPELTELKSLASSAGYGDADSYVSDNAGRDPDDPRTIAQKELFDAYEGGEYWTSIAESEQVLKECAKDASSKAMASIICDRIRLAYTQGRTERLLKDQADPSRPAGPSAPLAIKQKSSRSPWGFRKQARRKPSSPQ